MGEEKNTIWGDIVMFLLNKIIKNVGLAHGFKTINHVHGFGFKTMHMAFMHMVLKPCARISKQPSF